MAEVYNVISPPQMANWSNTTRLMFFCRSNCQNCAFDFSSLLVHFPLSLSAAGSVKLICPLQKPVSERHCTDFNLARISLCEVLMVWNWVMWAHKQALACKSNQEEAAERSVSHSYLRNALWARTNVELQKDKARPEYRFLPYLLAYHTHKPPFLKNQSTKTGVCILSGEAGFSSLESAPYLDSWQPRVNFKYWAPPHQR